jgi:NAD(P)-dependent dehydrogenase (short-subunit alcohol dehydrogenase family)
MLGLPFRRALIIGVATGISPPLARQLSAAGFAVALAARNVAKLAPRVTETGALPFAANAADPASVGALFQAVDERMGAPDVVIYNASARVQGPLTELEPEAVRRVRETVAVGGFLALRQATRRMEPQGRGAILLTGATASVRLRWLGRLRNG